jgi:GTP cyclohydrolase IA
MPGSDPLANLPKEVRDRAYEAAAEHAFDEDVVRELNRLEKAISEAEQNKHSMYPTEVNNPEGAAELLLTDVAGLDPYTDHAKETPARFVAMLRELTTAPDIKWKTFPATSDEMVTVRDIPFVSLCAHHIIPFMGVAHVGYVPNASIAGLSKLARVVQHYAKRLQVQEELTGSVADFLVDALKAHGVAVVMEAEHLCMTIRGAQVPGAKTRTSAMRGVFSDHTKTAKAEFFSWLNGR